MNKSPLLVAAVVTTICLVMASASVSVAAPGGPERPLAALEGLAPRTAAGFTDLPVDNFHEQAQALEAACASLAQFDTAYRPDDILKTLAEILGAKDRVDAMLDAALQLRRGFADLKDGPSLRRALGNYLKITAELIDLSGRLRYLLFDAVNYAAYELADAPEARERLIDLVLKHKSNIGAAVMSRTLFDPTANNLRRARPASSATKAKLLRLIAETAQADLVPEVARFVRQSRLRSELVIGAAETLRKIGLPQDAREDQDPELPKPAITAAELHAIVSRLNPSRLSSDLVQRRGELLSWLDERRRSGLTESRYRLGALEVEPGDWLLMRNPSPYNRFTDLSPGLFTHVGVVALETGSDGKRRMVVVDLPERGTEMPATNVEIFVQRTLHFVVLRHDDKAVRRKMGQAAATLVGNETEFDLSFRLDGIDRLRGKSLEDQKIKTYCAGLLVLCADQTELPRREFFPIAEHPAGGRMIENLDSLGIVVTDDVVSPTGAIFSQKMQIVGRREPMYDPRRSIEEAIYNHFTDRLTTKTLTPSPSWYQSLRLKLAEASQVTPLLGRVLARAADVNPEMDLVAAAKAATVVEILDEIAYGASGEFLAARGAIRAGPIRGLAVRRYDREEIAEIRRLQRRHATLLARWQQEALSPRELRIRLVEYYVAQGKRQLDERFFGDGE